MLLTVPFIEIGGKQKITIASLWQEGNLSLIVKGYKRSPQDLTLWGYA